MRRTGLILTALVFVLTASLPAAAEPKDEVAAVTREWATAFSDHNIERILKLYSKGALLWGTSAVALRTTPEDIRAFYKSAFGIQNIGVSFDNQIIRIFGNVAVVAGNYTFTASTSSDQKQERPARYSFTLVKEDHKWVIVDHHSSLVPTPTAPSRRA